MALRKQAEEMIQAAIAECLPDQAVKEALLQHEFGSGRVRVVAAGKGAWQMAKAAAEVLGGRADSGVVITKYGHVKGPIANMECFEAGHPVPDENGFSATRKAIEAVEGLAEEDTVLLLLSGGGSALFEHPLIPAQELLALTEEMLSCGADIVEINAVRKRMSAVKGGKFASLCAPAKVFCVALSDVLGDRADAIASGPACPDTSTCEEAAAVVKKYGLHLSSRAQELLLCETPKELPNAEIRVVGSVSKLCRAMEEQCRRRGYETVLLTDCLSCEAREAGAFLANIARCHAGKGTKRAFIAGGETVVHLRGAGKGGRNQELALSAAAGLAGLPQAALFSVGSDGTDGITDAAGGYVDEKTAGALREAGIDIFQMLENNDSYHALQKTGGLIVTGATGTNVNDVAVLLLSGEQDGGANL